MQMTWSTCRARSVKYALLCHKGLGFLFFILPISVDKDNSWCAGIFLRDSCSLEDVLHVIVTHDHHHTDCLVSSSDVESLTVVNIFSQIFLGFFSHCVKAIPMTMPATGHMTGCHHQDFVCRGHCLIFILMLEVVLETDLDRAVESSQIRSVEQAGLWIRSRLELWKIPETLRPRLMSACKHWAYLWTGNAKTDRPYFAPV